jgi:hypothetical protein
VPITPAAPPRLSITTGWPSSARACRDDAADHVDAAAGRERHDQVIGLVG